MSKQSQKAPSPDCKEPARSAVTSTGIPTALSADLLRPHPPGPSVLLLSLVGLVAAFVTWAAFAEIEEATRGEGRVIPASKIQLVQNLEGGIVVDIGVREGDRIKAGDVILRIDPTQADASHGETNERILGLRALTTRLEAELEAKALVFADDLKRDAASLVARQRQAHSARRRELDAALAGLDSQLRQREQELIELNAKVVILTRSLEIAEAQEAILAPLAKSRAASRSELLTAAARVNDTRGQLQAAQLAIPRVKAQAEEVRQRRAEKVSSYRAEAFEKLNTARVELAALEEVNKRSADKLARTIVKAPATGIVKTVHVTTIGQVVQPGSDLIEIVPVDEALLIQARIRPQDIAFLRPGQPARVKLTAYDFALYGGLDGEVVQIGADSVTDDKGDTYYLIKVRTKGSKLEHGGDDLPIIPGMVAQVDVLTGQKTVLAYLTKPLTRMRHDALRER
ncbi:MAG: HlyD family type I secretion periplasmic adaptor subunit [Alphaproteobacteria bacterium]|nr:HlyD family type I secretion periplasmic adaptor subunit [Alphaproteobacteria bacterium]